MSSPRVVDIVKGSPSELAGMLVNDVFLSLNGETPRDVFREPEGDRYLPPSVCLSQEKFLDVMILGDLVREVEAVATDGIALRRTLGSNDG